MADSADTHGKPIESEQKGGPVLTNGTTQNNGWQNNESNQNGAAQSNQAQAKSDKPAKSRQSYEKKDEEPRNNTLMHRVKTLASGPPGGFDDTPLPEASQGYTVRSTFESAANLPPSDISTGASDPYVHATLKACNPKRHREDPDLTHRTRTQRNTVNPVWHEPWIVANVPPSGFTLKCRLYDEDARDSDDRLGNVTIKVPEISETWEGIPSPGKEFMGKKRMMSKRAYFMKLVSSLIHSDVHMTPRLTISIEVLGKSAPPHAQMCTIGPTGYVTHFSPMIGRLTGIKVDTDAGEESKGETAGESSRGKKKKPKSQKYDFQANEMQLRGPVPAILYHRFVEFRPIIGSIFKSKGIRGKVLHMALHQQHERIYNYDASTKHGEFEACSEAASLQFLRLAHFDSGGRIFTYVLTLDAVFRFTETGKEFGIDLLSKHTMHSDVQRYIACSGEFFIRRLERPHASESADPTVKTHPDEHVEGGPPEEAPPKEPSYYQLIIDNDSGTYRPDKSVLPDLKKYLEENFPGLGIVAMHCDDDKLKKLKEAQHEAKKKEGKTLNLVMNASQSSISSAESDLDDRYANGEGGRKSKKETLLDAVEDPTKLKATVSSLWTGQQGARNGGKAN